MIQQAILSDLIIRPIPILIGSFNFLDIYLVGCGGTGSFLAPSLVRLVLELQQGGCDVRLTFVDHDHVSDRNIPRQNFCPGDLGGYKAALLASRYGIAFGVEIAAIVEPFNYQLVDRPRWHSQTILIGCVDNSPARSELSTVLSSLAQYNRQIWYLDCGNHGEGIAAGQVLLGSTNNFDLQAAFNDLENPSFCVSLPAPGLQHPELLENHPEDGMDEHLSCTQIAERNKQALFINQRVAVEAVEMINRLINQRSLNRFATYFNCEWGSARSEYITVANLKKFSAFSDLQLKSN
ncbi:ThiF family adenylyltransferase [Gloeothece verrucosa]|uniref:UBA/THIF-type NAD/FAD binding protein n=1 Tax=Gloeothece verrucosa (strain PCC 7822) TaxID=497965 RepID=E0UMF0_GLOV7|nr:ThiF family adenylyltransferase [Gloeothece verrucosa]ADN18130.1 UBA/THIF-type NAD/FAD binding protein [Gloeothece verrucosa PCC 7822]